VNTYDQKIAHLIRVICIRCQKHWDMSEAHLICAICRVEEPLADPPKVLCPQCRENRCARVHPVVTRDWAGYRAGGWV
jgi:hypothetical protein